MSSFILYCGRASSSVSPQFFQDITLLYGDLTLAFAFSFFGMTLMCGATLFKFGVTVKV